MDSGWFLSPVANYEFGGLHQKTERSYTAKNLYHIISSNGTYLIKRKELRRT